MMTSPRSFAVSARDFRTFSADAAMFLCASGTIFGRDVVPDVCSTSAMSSGVAARTGLGVTVSPPSYWSENAPAPWPA